MTIFYLPDLGEGLPEAEIHEWFIKEGDEVKKDQPIVAMETAKAVVEVPAPQSGVIKKLYGQVGDLIKTGQPLMEFTSLDKSTSSTVVGQLEEHQDVGLQHIQSEVTHPELPKATFSVKKLAAQLGVSLENIIGTGAYGVITAEDVKMYAPGTKKQSPNANDVFIEPIIGVRRQMMKTMQLSHQEIVPVSIFDEVSITHWKKPFDITVKLIQSICYAAQKEPALNAWFQNQERKIFKNVNLGLAVDSDDGLFVPIIKNANQLSSEQLRLAINDCKKGVQERSLTPDAFQNGTIILSNFGRYAGKFANPIIVPPMVAIIAVGKLFDSVIATTEGFASQTKLPISLTFDHRPLTGGEATRFLGAMIEFLEK